MSRPWHDLRRRLAMRHELDDARRALTSERSAHRSTTRRLEFATRRLDEALTEIDLRRRADAWPVLDPPRHDGVNVVGYLHHQLGLGEDARRLVDILHTGGVPVSAVSYALTASPVVPEARSVEQRLDHTTSIAVMAADQVMLLSRLHPELRRASRRLIGYCMWELTTLSDEMRRGARSVDEIWVRSTFAGAAFAELGTPSVHVVPLPIPEPEPADLGRGEFPILAGARDRIVFGVVFDHFSVMQRKNPIGAVEAFKRAFRPDEGPLLVVKSINAEHFPVEHAQLVAATAGRNDIVIWDAHLPRAEHLALIANFDALVSLHRSEGFGLHLGEAMWMGVPVIATGYSGNLDFMDDHNACLVGHRLIEVQGGGQIYPVGARWADPDVEHAADLMRRVADDEQHRRAIGRSGRATMAAQPSDAETADLIAARLGLPSPS